MRRDWTKDYMETTGPDGRRSYAYTGDRFELSENARRAYAMSVTPGMVVILILLTLMGFTNSEGSRAMYVALPWAVCCFAAALGMFDLLRILLTRRALTKHDYHSGALRLKRTLAFLIAVCAAAFAGYQVFMGLNGYPLLDRAAYGISFMNLIISIQMFLAERKILWKQVPSKMETPSS